MQRAASVFVLRGCGALFTLPAEPILAQWSKALMGVAYHIAYPSHAAKGRTGLQCYRRLVTEVDVSELRLRLKG